MTSSPQLKTIYLAHATICCHSINRSFNLYISLYSLSLHLSWSISKQFSKYIRLISLKYFWELSKAPQKPHSWTYSSSTLCWRKIWPNPLSFWKRDNQTAWWLHLCRSPVRSFLTSVLEAITFLTMIIEFHWRSYNTWSKKRWLILQQSANATHESVQSVL